MPYSYIENVLLNVRNNWIMTALDQLTSAINWSEQALRLFWRRFPKRNGVHFMVTFVAIGIAWVAIFIGQAVSPFDGLEPLFETSRSSQVLGAAVVSSALVYMDEHLEKTELGVP